MVVVLYRTRLRCDGEWGHRHVSYEGSTNETGSQST